MFRNVSFPGCCSLPVHLVELLIVLSVITYKRTNVFLFFLFLFFFQILGHSKIIITVVFLSFMWNKIVLVYFKSYIDAGTCLDRNTMSVFAL